ncbi:hypothetical protein GOP47_0026864 [Adiantum capillus-veneris]|nr:hypothetical protein GOP47_0026864 [Adiantum capillus-veneris]
MGMGVCVMGTGGRVAWTRVGEAQSAEQRAVLLDVGAVQVGKAQSGEQRAVMLDAHIGAEADDDHVGTGPNAEEFTLHRVENEIFLCN